MPAELTQNPEIILSFTASELAQLEAFATLHGMSVPAFVQRAALDAVNISKSNISKSKSSTDEVNALWLSENLTSTPEAEEAPDWFAPVDAQEQPRGLAVAPSAPAPKRGVAGEPSTLAKGHGPVWEIRRALGGERVHGLGWTREQLAFVLKLSVVGVRKMEHLGTAPVKSLEARKSLLNLAKTLEKPTPQICAYLEREKAALG